MQAAGCTGLDALNPVCQIGSIGGSLATSGFESVLNGISQWVASGAEWLLGQIGDVLVSTTSIDVGATWFRTHYGQMTALAGVVILPMLLLSTLQAVLRQNPGQLVRTYLVQLPLALLLAVVAIQIVILSLSATDTMSDAIAGGSGADVATLLSTVTKGLVVAAADPSIASFVLLLIALLIAVAAFVLWIELLIRAAAVYVAVLFLPLAMATLVWPAVSHWCRRLVETLAALILSKFVIVATLSLAAGAVASGASGAPNSGGFSAVLAGGALLVMATFVPFAILRLIPAIEAGAVGHLDGLRQRGTATVSAPLRTAARHALHAGLTSAGDARHMAQAAAGALGGAGSRPASAGVLGRGLVVPARRWRWRNPVHTGERRDRPRRQRDGDRRSELATHLGRIHGERPRAPAARSQAHRRVDRGRRPCRPVGRRGGGRGRRRRHCWLHRRLAANGGPSAGADSAHAPARRSARHGAGQPRRRVEVEGRAAGARPDAPGRAREASLLYRLRRTRPKDGRARSRVAT